MGAQGLAAGGVFRDKAWFILRRNCCPAPRAQWGIAAPHLQPRSSTCPLPVTAPGSRSTAVRCRTSCRDQRGKSDRAGGIMAFAVSPPRGLSASRDSPRVFGEFYTEQRGEPAISLLSSPVSRDDQGRRSSLSGSCHDDPLSPGRQASPWGDDVSCDRRHRPLRHHRLQPPGGDTFPHEELRLHRDIAPGQQHRHQCVAVVGAQRAGRASPPLPRPRYG